MLQRMFLACFILVVAGHALCMGGANEIVATIEAAKSGLKDTLASHAMHIEYWAETTAFYEPVEVSDDKTTALVHVHSINVMEPSGDVRPLERQTSYSEELHMGYEVKYHKVNAWYAEERARIIRDFNTTESQSYEIGNLETTSALSGTERLVVSYNGNFTRGFMQSKNRLTGNVLNYGMERPGDVASLHVFSPIHAYALPNSLRQEEIEERDGEIYAVRRNAEYRLLPEQGYAVGTMLMKGSGIEFETEFSDFAPVENTALPLPRKIVETRRSSGGTLESRSVVQVTNLRFVPRELIPEETFILEFPAGVDMGGNSLLNGAMMRMKNR